MDCTVFDVETANSQRASICSIGIIRYEGGKVVFEKEYLVNPEVEFHWFNIHIHGITEEMVQDAPTFAELWPNIRKYFENTVLVAHNARSMDLNALYGTLQRYQLPLVTNKYICTYELAKEMFGNNSDITSYRLNILCEKLGVAWENHHDALADAKACLGLLLYFMGKYPLSVCPLPYEATPCEQ